MRLKIFCLAGTALLAGTLLLAGTGCRLFPGGDKPHPTPSPTVSAPAPGTCANLPKVWHPWRLKAIQPCASYRGKILANLGELDGDHHLWVAPDPGYEGLLNAANIYRGQKA